MPMKLYSEDSIQDIADAIRTKNGLSDTYKVAEMAQAIIDLPSGTGGVTQDSDGYLVLDSEGGGTDYYEMRILNLECNEYRNENITSLNAPGIIHGWSNLKKLSLPNLSGRIGVQPAFNNNNNANLEIDIKNVTGAVNMAFQNLHAKWVVLPKWEGKTGGYQFYGGNIQTIDFGEGLTGIDGAGLTSARGTIIFRRTASIVTLDNTNALLASVWGSSGTGGTLYVPSALISSYQSATNWSTILSYANNQILPIEGSQYETHYADGTVIS